MGKREIIIQNPKLNTNPYRRFSYSENHKNFVAWKLQEAGIHADTHTHGLDLCAGDGPGAWIMTELGMQKDHILCVDKEAPNPPIVKGIPWLHVDVNEFSRELSKESDQRIPLELQPLKHRFDIIISAYPQATESAVERVVNFFLQPGGKYIKL